MLASECIARIQELIEVAGKDVEICGPIGPGNGSNYYEPIYFELTNVRKVENPKGIPLYECTDNNNDQQIITIY